MLSLLPPFSPHLLPILDLLHDPEHLWSPYGIRSLSASHPEFGRGENYWKGPIWIQMNYMVLSSLYKVCCPICWAGNCAGTEGMGEQTYAAVEGPYQEYAKQIYTELRENVVENVYKVYISLLQF